VLFILAQQRGLLSLVAVLVSLYPASTLLLARYVLGERLNTVQVVGIGFTLAAVALIAAG
jgi:drug/metabolite transporter (DMT)-like permease